MQITSSNGTEINAIKMKHSGKDLNFQWIMEPRFYDRDPSEICIKPTGTASFTFDDLWEVDQLINALTRFRKECYGRMGQLCMTGVDLSTTSDWTPTAPYASPYRSITDAKKKIIKDMTVCSEILKQEDE